MYRSIAANRSTAGFTLIEVLVALSIVTIALSSIGALIASTSRGARSIEAGLTRMDIAREVMTALPDRDQLASGNLWGEIAGHHWRLDISRFETKHIGLIQTGPWIPQSLVVTIQSPTGATTQLHTVRLRRMVVQ